MLLQVDAPDADLSRCRLKEAGQHPHDGTFPGTVVSQQPHNLASADTERDVINSQQAAITP